jgi:hypothetical protein
MSYRAYTGVGSRTTPDAMEPTIFAIAQTLAKQGFTLRSGGALGADTFFERGAGTAAEIYRPQGLDRKTPAGARMIVPKGEVLDRCLLIASVVHPNWAACSEYARLLHARNVCQVHGEGLDAPSEFLVCWAKPDGRGGVEGGTGLAWRIAGAAGIPCYNLFVPGQLELLRKRIG